MTRKPYLALVVAILSLLTTGSCKSDDEPEYRIPGAAVYDFVTVKESKTNGTVFSFQRIDDSPEVLYTTPYSFSKNEKINEGDRLIICYTKEDLYTPGAINLYGYLTISNTELGVLKGGAVDYNDWQSQRGKLTAIWRTGDYINLQTDVYVKKVGRPERFIMVADTATLADDYPVIHIICDMPKENTGLNLNTVYSSFNVSEVWNLPTCLGLRIYFPGTDGDILTTITKQK